MNGRVDGWMATWVGGEWFQYGYEKIICAVFMKFI